MKLYKNAIILLLVLAVLGGAYYFVLKWEPKKETVKNDTVSIFKTEKENISEISIDSINGKYVFYREGEEWKVKDNSSIKLNQSKVDTLAYDIATINAEQVVEENPQDLAQYGLDSPTSTVEVKLTDGSIKKFFIGNKTPTKTAYYFKDNDVNTVYTVYSGKGESLSSSLDSYRDKSMFSVNAEDITSFTIEGKNRQKLVVTAKGENKEGQIGTLSAWNVIEPYNINGDNENINKLVLNKISQISAQDVVEDNPADLGKYGLDSPAYTVQFTHKDNQTVKLFIGNTENDVTYVRLDNNPAVFSVSSSSLDFKDVKPFQLIEKYVLIPNIETVSKIVMNSKEGQITMEIIKNGDNYEYKVNDKTADESAFKKAYQEIIVLKVDGIAEQQAKADSELSYTFYFNNGNPETKIEFVSIEDRNYVVVKNGEGNFYIRKKKVEQMFESIKAFAENPTEKKE